MKAELQKKIKSQLRPVRALLSSRNGLLQPKCACYKTPGAEGECKECREKRLDSKTQQLSQSIHPLRTEHIGHDFSRIPVHFSDLRVPQAKLVVGNPDDQYEREANRLADEIVAISGPGTHYGLGGGIEQPAEPQRRARSEHWQASNHDGSIVQCQANGPDPAQQDEEEQIDLGGNGFGLSRQGESQVQAMRGGGEPLPVSERAFMEPRFRYSFEQVRIHTDAKAADMAQLLGARAFTVGQDIVFGQSEYKPATVEGRRLLAHELAHVIQQNHSDSSRSIRPVGEQRIQRYLVGPPERIDASTVTGPTFGRCREFNWVIQWDTDVRDGFILQECMNMDTITRCDGTNVPAPNTPHYWEAWPVNSSGTVGDGGQDTWFRARRSGTQGNWQFDSNVFAVRRLDPAWGFKRGGVATAGVLLSTTTGPNKDTDLYQPSLTRSRGGEWNCCGGNDYNRPR